MAPDKPPINFARVDLVSIRLAVECAAAGSISAAAERCHFSVMGASERLRRLEDSLGKQLFHRHRHGLQPTEAGRLLATHGRVILQAVEAMTQDVRTVPACDPRHKPNTGRAGKAAAQPPS